MVIKPLVGQHTSQKEDPERGMGFDRAFVFAEEFEPELVLPDQFWTERYGADVHGQPYNVPQGQENG